MNNKKKIGDFMKNKNKEGEPICPNCKEPLEGLDYRKKSRDSGIFTIENDADGEFIPNDYSINEADYEFECSECDEVLTENIDEAVKILKGEAEMKEE